MLQSQRFNELGPFTYFFVFVYKYKLQIQKVIQIQNFLLPKPICKTLPICRKFEVLQIQWKNDHRAAFEQNTTERAEISSAHRPNDARS